MEIQRLEHPIPPFFKNNSKVLILGTFPSPKSREAGFFYGHPQNRFWRVLAAVFSEKPPECKEEKCILLEKHHIALWDVLKSCEIQGASDSSIRNPVVNDFTPIFKAADIKMVFCTGAASYSLYKKLNGGECIKLPSPSPANCAVPFERLVEEYRAILKYTE